MLTPSQNVSTQARGLLLNDPPYDDCSVMTITPVRNPFTPSKGLDLDTLTAADFSGSTPLVGGAVPIVRFVDPSDGKDKLRIPEPAGGWNWLVTGGANLPQTIYGVKVDAPSLSIFVGSMKLSQQVVLTVLGQGFGVGDIIINLEDINLSNN